MHLAQALGKPVLPLLLAGGVIFDHLVAEVAHALSGGGTTILTQVL